MPRRQNDIPEAITDWFARYGWEPFGFQRQTWAAYRQGRSGLLHAPTGMGKTLAVWMGPLIEWMVEHSASDAGPEPEPLRVLWITPLRALATDTMESLRVPVADMGLPWRVEKRTGDTPASQKVRQRDRLPTALVTTPESLSLLLSYHDARERLATLRCVIVDEWHELMGTKRGVQTELCLARLRGWMPEIRTWGLSATLGNIGEALEVLVGPGHPKSKRATVSGIDPKEIVIETLVPEEIERFPWGGHLGLKVLPRVVGAVEAAESTLLFTNTRSQAELWYNALLEARPEWGGRLALHHGSLDRAAREQVEESLRTGEARCVVCTSSLDLGVDFTPVDQVIQVGSPKGIARLLQRAGRSGHRPGAVSRILCVPTNAFELIEFSAARAAADARRIEPRPPLRKPLDVLVQHLVTMGLGGGFSSGEALGEVRRTYSYTDLSDDEWSWALDFAARGGRALGRYPQYQRLAEKEGVFKPTSEAVGRRHRLGIGTITSDSSVAVKYTNGSQLGTVEEWFVARLKPGDRFLFAGKVVELVGFRDMTAKVRASTGKTRAVPRWMGGKMPLSSLLADEVRDRLEQARQGVYTDREMVAVRPLLELQREMSLVPGPDDLLIETTRTREGHHAFVFPFAGRLVHEGLAAMTAFRIARESPRTITTMVNDYGFELLGGEPFEGTESDWRRWLSAERLLEDLVECLNATELAKRQFRGIARVAGLLLEGHPGRDRKSARQLQASSGLLYDVFRQFDPGNLLLEQARREVLENQLELARLRATLESLGRRTLHAHALDRLTPLSFPLWAERIREQVSSEKFADRVGRMLASLERSVGADGAAV